MEREKREKEEEERRTEYMDELKDEPKPKLPDGKNWYKEGKVTVSYDQHGCGGCWAFSSAAATESLAAISGYDKKL